MFDESDKLTRPQVSLLGWAESAVHNTSAEWMVIQHPESESTSFIHTAGPLYAKYEAYTTNVYGSRCQAYRLYIADTDSPRVEIEKYAIGQGRISVHYNVLFERENALRAGQHKSPLIVYSPLS